MERSHRTIRLSILAISASLALLVSLILPAAGQVGVSSAAPPADPLAVLSGTVKDNTGTAISGAQVQAIIPGTAQVAGSGLSDATGSYTLSIPPGTYDIRVVPPAGSGFQTSLTLGQTLGGDMTMSFILVPNAAAVTLSGRVVDRQGNGVPGQTLYIRPAVGGNNVPGGTDAWGNYSREVSPGSYLLWLEGWNLGSSLNAPQGYRLSARSSLTLTQDATMDISVPAKKVSVHVQDPSGQAVGNVGITTGSVENGNLNLGTLPASGFSWQGSPVATDSLGDAVLWLFPTPPAQTDPDEPPGVGSPPGYTFTAAPPAGSAFAVTYVQNVTVSDDISVTITLVAAVTLSGKVVDRQGNGLPGQTLYIRPAVGGNNVPGGTDAWGNYSREVSPGSYFFWLEGWNLGSSLNAPQGYRLSARSSLTLTQDVTMDISVPAKKVSVHVQDPSGQAVGNVGITTGSVENGNLNLGTLPASGFSWQGSPVATDSLGDAVLWLFPTPPAQTDPDEPPGVGSPPGYTFTAAPPAGSPYATVNLQNIPITTDTDLVVVLQFVNPPPVTTAIVGSQPNAQGLYVGPVTVSLAAAASAGLTVWSTYYVVDGGATYTYAGPFAVSGGGPHTVRYWSVDSRGVPEAPNTLSLTILVPMASGDSARVPQGASNVPMDVLANDVPTPGSVLSVSAVTSPTSGSVAVGASGGWVIYTAQAGWTGLDTFGYTATTGTLTDTAQVTVTVHPGNAAPVAATDAITVAVNSSNNALAVLVNDSDADADILFVSAVTQGARGSATIGSGGRGLLYAPSPGSFGADSFTYTVSDGLATNVGTVNVTIDRAPVALNDTARVASTAPATPSTSWPTTATRTAIPYPL